MRIGPNPRQIDVERFLAANETTKTEQSAQPLEILENEQSALNPPGHGFEDSLDAFFQKARIASIVPPFYAAPNAVAKAATLLASPDAGLVTPKPKVVSELTEMLKKAKAAAESGDEKDRAAVDK